jgi:wobble nucleotide-excising tRNase
MKITRFNKIEKYRSFKKFLWSNANLPDFADYNLIYGWNGTGKTTLSEIFRAIEQRATSFEGEFTFQNSNSQQVSSSNIVDGWSANIPTVRVFNKNYINQNIFETLDGDITPIFFLGEENVDKQKEVERLKLLLSGSEHEKGIEAKLAETEAQKTQLSKDINKHCSDGAKHIKDTLRSSGQNLYNNYDIRYYNKTIEAISKKEEPAANILNDQVKTSLIEKVKASPKAAIDFTEIHIPDISSIHTSIKEICLKTVVSEVIEALSQNENLADWTKVGLGLHKDGDHKDCRFCNQPLPLTRISELEKHFNDDYETFIRNIDSQSSELKNLINGLKEISFPKKLDLDVAVQNSFEEKVSAFNNKKSDLINFLEEIHSLLMQKKGKPFVVMSCDLIAPEGASEEASGVAAIIDKHNKGVENYNSVIADARSKIEKSIIADNYQSYRQLKQQFSELKTNEELVREQVKEAKADIIRIEKEIKEHRKPAEEINEDLASYLGHGELRFETKENGYAILRSDFLAENLSEGEKTAIALLYFLKSLQDTSFNIKNGIVVIDDPVSSMDDSALFYAFGFIKEKTKKAGQLFILTHNFMFFRQVKNWFKHLPKKKVSYYQTFMTVEDDKRSSGIKTIDKLLTNHESEYHYLFSIVLKNASTTNDNSSLAEYYHLPNVARRVLECFLAFKYPSKHQDKRLYHMLKEVSLDQSKKIRIGRFLDVYSHKNHFGSSEHDPSILAETPAILRDVLELMKSEDEQHYKEMIELLAANEQPVKLVSNG